MMMIFSNDPTIKKFWGILEYKPQWSLSLKGWLLLGFCIVITLVIFVTQVHAFLTPSKPLKGANLLVVEGWLPDLALKGAYEEYQKNHYQIIITTGSPIERGAFFSQYQSYANLAANTLIKLGIDPQKIVPITTQSVPIDRTAAAAIAVKEWLKTANLSEKSANIYSYDIHTRRSYLVYRKILKTDLKLGVIAYSSPYYNHHQWWESSYSFKMIINELIGYLYTRIVWFYFK